MPKKEKSKVELPEMTNPAVVAAGRKMRMLSKIGLGLAVLLMIGAIGAAGYFYNQVNHLKANPGQAAADETQSVMAVVGKLIVLPDDEQPTLATVTDPEKLQTQAFFASAKKGDKVLIYTKARKAILYSPEENKIVEVAPINIGEEPQVSGASDETKSTEE